MFLYHHVSLFYLPDITEMQAIQNACESFGLPCLLMPNMTAVVWGKLLLNLNNSINALSGLPLKTQLSRKGYRVVLAKCQEELLVVCSLKKIPLAKLTAVSPRLIPYILRLPNWLFRIVASKMLAIDPKARSSMWEDIDSGRETEIHYLNGAVVAMANELGINAPANQVVTEQLILLSQAKDKRPLSDEALQTLLSRK